MKVSDWEVGFAEDLARVAAIADPTVQQAIAKVAEVWQPMVRNRLMELLTTIGAELSDSPGLGGVVDLRIAGDSVSFTLTPEETDGNETPTSPPSEPADADARISLRISESLKERIAVAAGRDGMSVNTWISRALEREVTRPRSTHSQTTTARNQLRGYGRS